MMKAPLSFVMFCTYGVVISQGFQLSTSSRRARAVNVPKSKSVRAFPSNVTSQRTRSLFQTSPSNPSETKKALDTGALVKYGTASVIQLSLISLFFFGIDSLLAVSTKASQSTLPAPLTWMICYAFSLKSAGFRDRKMPTWTPPGPVFPIVWLLIIAPLRATSSTMIVQSLGKYFTIPLMSLMLHLSCGDIWNTINNSERRYGTSVLGIATVYFSALHAAWQYYQVNSLAGKLLGATAIWLTIASSLIIRTWQINPGEDGKKESLLPLKNVGERSVTQFAWGKKKSVDDQE
jgi:translocator protein